MQVHHPEDALLRRSPGYVRQATALVVTLAVVLGACATGGDRSAEGVPGPVSSSTAPATTAPDEVDFPPDRPVPFTTDEVSWADPTRPTEPVVAGAPSSADRPLPTTIRVPEGDGAGPVVVFAHGLGSSPERFSGLLDAWARAGYVVVAPRFPLTSDANPDHNLEVGDQVNLPADVSFVIDEVLVASRTPGDPLEGRVDPDAIGVAGFSLGGGATYALAYSDVSGDPRIRSAAILASAILVEAANVNLSRAFPLLVIHSTADEQLPYAYAEGAVSQVAGPVWFATLEGFNHHDPFDDVPTPVDDAVVGMTTAFWDLTLGDGGVAAAADLGDAADAGGELVSLDVRWE
jgi:dienelactone hydrolase